MYSILLTIIYIAFISLGLPDSLVGAGWPVMHKDLDVPQSFAGIITMIIAIGTILSSLASERLTRRFGAGLVTAISVGLTATALFGFAFSDQFWMLCLWAIPYGVGAGAVDAALNNYVALHYAARHMNWLHSFWGVGASISPLIMSHALTSGMGWPGAYNIVGIIQAVLTAALLFTLPLWGKINTLRSKEHQLTEVSADSQAVPSQPPASGHVPLTKALKIPGVVLILTTFFAYCALESTSILWSSTYLVGARGVSAATAAAFASFFLIGITLGRFLAGIVADRIGDRNLIRGGFVLVAVAGVMILLPLETNAVALAGLAIAGLGAAPIYPAIIHSTPTNFGRNNSQAIIGIQMASAYLGSTLMPPLFGIVSQWVGLWIFPVFVLVLAILGILFSERLNRRVDAQQAPIRI